jgi:hypothetical protein
VRLVTARRRVARAREWADNLPAVRVGRTAVGTILATAAIAVGASPAYGQADQTIPAGVRAGGVELGGMTVPAAANALKTQVGDVLAGRIIIKAGYDTRFMPSQVDLKFDATRTAQRALAAQAGTEVPLAVTYSKVKLDKYVDELAVKTDQEPRDARLRMTTRRMIVYRSRFGRILHKAELERALGTALTNPQVSRFITVKWRKVTPKVTVATLRRQYRTVITIDRYAFKLRMFKGLRLRKTYKIAVGAVGWTTPSGRYQIRNKAVCPAWHVPSWGGSLAGQVVPGCTPQNPLKARWLGIVGGVGIHGTADTGSLGTRASHGCIRMTVPSVVELYRWVPVGTPVLIK